MSAAHDDGVNDPMNEVRADLEQAERKIASEIDPGARALVVAVAVLVLLGSFSLPHAGGAANGWEILSFGQDAVAEDIALPPASSCGWRWSSVVCARSWRCSPASGCSRGWPWRDPRSPSSSACSRSGAGRRCRSNRRRPAPGFGLVLGWFAVMVLTFHWTRVVWARTSLQLAAEEELRRAAAEEERKGLFGDDR